MDFRKNGLGQIMPETPGERLVDLTRRMQTMESYIPTWTAHMQDARSFFDKHEEREETLAEIQKQRHQENATRLEEINSKLARKSLITAIVQVIWGSVGALIGILTLVQILRGHSAVDVFHLFSQQTQAVRAEIRADNPPF